MERPRLYGGVFACVAMALSTASSASVLIYNFTGTVTDPGSIAGVSASLGDTITGQFAYDSSTLDSNPGDTTSGVYLNPGIVPPLNITLPSGSITFDSGTSVFVTVDTEINVAAGAPDPTVAGAFLDHDITFSLKPTSTALATDALPTNIDLDDFDSASGKFSSFDSTIFQPVGDPIFYTIETLTQITSGGVVVIGTSGDDTLTVDLTSNTYSFDGGITQILFSGDLEFNGGLGNDTLVVNGDAGNIATFGFLNSNDGEIVIDGQTISYTGLEPIVFDVDIQQLVFDYTNNGVDTVVLSDDSTSADGVSRIDSTAGELVDFASANVQIIDILLNEADSFSNTGLDSLFDGTVNVIRDMQKVPIPPITLLLGAGIAGIGFQRRKQTKAR